MTQVGTGRLYTNYYFKPNSSGEIYAYFDVTAYGAAVFRVGIYDMSANQSVASLEYDVNSLGKTGTVRFYNLSTSTNYAVYYQSVYDGFSVVYVSGSSTIYR